MEIKNNYMDFDDEEVQQEAEDVVMMLMTVVDGRDFAFRFENVKRLAQVEEIFPVPEFPDYILGFTKLDDSTFAVIDARRRFGFEPQKDSDRRCMIVAEEDGIEVGIIVDEARKLRRTPVSDVLPAEKLNDEAYTRYITAMFKRTAGSICYVLSPKLMYSLTSEGYIAAARKKHMRYRIKEKNVQNEKEQ